MTNDTSGPFFPVTAEQSSNGFTPLPGCTLRQWYVGMALQGLCANSEAIYPISKEEKALGITWCDKIATEAYEIADAILARSEK